MHERMPGRNCIAQRRDVVDDVHEPPACRGEPARLGRPDRVHSGRKADSVCGGADARECGRELVALRLRRHRQAERDREIPRTDVERRDPVHPCELFDAIERSPRLDLGYHGDVLERVRPQCQCRAHRSEAPGTAGWIKRGEHRAPRLVDGVHVRDDDPFGAEIEDTADLDPVVRAQSDDWRGAVRFRD